MSSEAAKSHEFGRTGAVIPSAVCSKYDVQK